VIVPTRPAKRPRHHFLIFFQVEFLLNPLKLHLNDSWFSLGLVLQCLLSTKLLVVFNQIFYPIINSGSCIFTIDITCCSLHIAPRLKDMISRHLFVPLTHSSCKFACKNYNKNSRQPDTPLPPEKDDHQFFYCFAALT